MMRPPVPLRQRLSVMHLYSGRPMHFCSGVDIHEMSPVEMESSPAHDKMARVLSNRAGEVNSS
jgi:hypothetical protein